MRIEIVYATAEEQVLVALELAEGSSAETALRDSGILQRFPGIDLQSATIGIFGKVVGPERVLRDGDRIEIYRPLRTDPKEARRSRAARRP
jgi:putative ubiquitin-RnfH superfamily antitoxin RatB of RatAB toxin-antitoxin module